MALLGAEQINAISLSKDVTHELDLKDVGGISKTWERGTTNMVTEDMKVLDIKRKVPNDPSKSRSAWLDTRTESRKIAEEQRAQEAAWNAENDTAVAKYKKQSFDKIFENERARDAGNKQFYVNPASHDSQLDAAGPGFTLDKSSQEAAGDEDVAKKDADEVKDADAAGDAPEKKAALQISGMNLAGPFQDPNANPPNQADISFQRYIKQTDNVVAKQQDREKEWIDEYKGNKDSFTSGTHNQKLTNYRAREGVYQNNWHHSDTWPKLMQVRSFENPIANPLLNPPNQADISFQRAIKQADATVSSQQNRESEWKTEHKENLTRDASQTHNKKLTNYRAREGVYQNNWHHTDTWPALK